VNELRDLLRTALFLPEGGSTFSDRVDDMHFVIIGTTMAVGLGIGLVTLFFVVRYRRRSEGDAPPRLTAPPWLEAIFVSVPLTLFLVWGAVGFADYEWAHVAPRGALDVYVVGKQWMWKFAWPDGGSDINVLRVPVGRPIRLLITSRDVIHSFFVPAFRLKQDAVPGRYTEIWFEAKKPGRYPVYCAEFCGLDHSQMSATVEVLSEADFERWRQDSAGLRVAQGLVPGGMAEHGRSVAADKGCLKCHTLDGTAHIGPTWLGLYGREETLMTGQRVVADEGYLTESMMDPGAKIVLGFLPVMPSFQGQLTPAEVASLLELIKSLRPAVPTASQEPVYVPR
jgi:cytochrome c oxidase subunit 2